MAASDISIRTNAQFPQASWWNVLRSALVTLEAFLGTYLGETSFTIVNNQTSAADVTSLLFSGASLRAFKVEYWVYRNTTSAGATERVESGILLGAYKTVAASWEMTQIATGTSGVTFTITAGGQVQYISDNQSGTAATSSMKFKYTTMAV